MAVNPDDLLSTPSAYATPAQVAQARSLAQLLDQQNASQGEIHSPYEGMAEMTRAVMAGLTARHADQMQQFGQSGAAEQLANLLAGKQVIAPPADTRGASSATLLPGAETAGLEWGSGQVPMDAAKYAIAQNESGGKYDEVGPLVLHGSYAGDRAYGKYQVMGKDLSNRLRAVSAAVLAKPRCSRGRVRA
jgi:hypothetical protein